MTIPAPLASILIVDDTIENLRLLANMLGEHGYEARPVTSGAQALQAATHDPPDLVLLDISMPDMDGYEVFRRLQDEPLTRDLPVIFLTAFSDTDHKIRAFEMGGVDYITKPFQVDEVLARVHTHISLRRARLELEHSYAELRSLEKLRDDLVHMVVHDMGSPLTTLQIRLDVLRLAKSELNEEMLEDVDDALESVAVLSRMTLDLIDLSRLEQGKMPLTLEICDLTELAARVRDTLGSLDRERPITLEHSGPVVAQCDPVIIRRVIENLVSNCVKHTPAGSAVRIVLTEGIDRVRIAVHDQGPGIAPDARARIFEKFGTLETRQQQRYHSSGLGLAFCKLAVEAHRGTIGVDAGVSSGSTFWFELPTAAE